MEIVSARAISSPSCSIPSKSPSKVSTSSRACACPVPSVQKLHSNGFVASLVGSLVASVVPPSLAEAYNELNDVVSQVETTSAASGGGFDGLSSGVVAAGVALAVAVPLIAFQFANSQSSGSVSASAAFAGLGEENAQLLDIREVVDSRGSGRPDLKSLRKKVVQVTYKSEDPGFVNKVLAKYRDAENTTLYILDESDGDAAAVAKLLAKSGFAKAFAITGGVEGWQTSELPWIEPRKGFNFNIDGLKNLVSNQENSNLVPLTLGAVAAAGISVAVFTEAETVFQLLGSAAVVQFFAKKFVFADDREKTLKEIQTFLDTKVAPKDFGDELKEVGRILNPRETRRAHVDTKVEATASAALEKTEREVDAVVSELKVADQA